MSQTAKFRSVLRARVALQKVAVCLFCALVLAPVISSGQSVQLRNGTYKCNNERVVIVRCRHDSDMPGYPPTTPQQDYCAVEYLDRPLHNGFTVETVELRGDMIRKLQACGALPGGSTSTNTSTPNPAASSSSETAEAYIEQAEPYFNGKDAAKAIDPLKKAIALSPSVTAYNELGIAYMNLGQYADSAAALEQAVKLDPKDANLHLNLGYVYLKQKQYDSAVSTLEDAFHLNSNSPDIANQLGIALEDSKDYVRAGSAYRLSTQLDPKFTAGYINFGELCIRAGDRNDALEMYRLLQKVDQDEANSLYMDIFQADSEKKKPPSAADRAKAYANLDIPTLLAKASKGDDAAMKQLSDLYYAKKDNANGLQWEMKAAAKGDQEIQNDLGWKYENGVGGAAKSVSQARVWYEKAAKSSYDTAELNLCQSYAAELNLDEGVVSGAGKDNVRSPIPALSAPKTDIDAGFHLVYRRRQSGIV